ncbi:hypothetical protein GGR54DRAFT_583025 [Hypoxylon sp. NC1633]|nr:hypothetical protein GGR54DRAFT_583025 [Hypoxylon sp. NC1633]
MRILIRIDGSISGAIFSCRPSLSLRSPASSAPRVRVRDGYTGVTCGLLAAAGLSYAPTLKKKHHRVSYIFTSAKCISSTITSSACRPSTSTYSWPNLYSGRKWSHAAAEPTDASLPVPTPMSRRELLELVDQYDDTSVEEHLSFLRDPYLRRYAPADGPNLVVSDKKEDVNLQSVNPRQMRDPEETKTVQRLREAVLLKLRRPVMMDIDTIFDLYQSLPGNRASYITANLRHQLLAALGSTERKDSRSMLRYFSVVTDVKNCGFPLTRAEWNTTISFASRYVGKSTEVEVEAALRLWREMEETAGIHGSDVTFNILFDVASKSGKLDLAEMIYQQMTTRGLPFNRYHHVSLIHFFGLKQDAGGVRAAYKEMVESGEVIDTIVLNCVISGFLASGEEDAAERIYKKMKVSDKRAELVPDRNYTMQKSMTKVLMMFAKIAKSHPDMLPKFQQTAVICPDLQTYRLLINHYGPKLGNLAKVTQFLDEMRLFNVPLHGAVFLALFKAFGKHGGAGSDWSPGRLTSVWKAFLGALDDRTEGLYISTWMAMAILRAFTKCSTRGQILDIYEALKSRWDLDETNSQFMIDFLKKLMEQPGFHVQSTGITF